MSESKERLAGLSPVEQRTLLAERLRKKASKPRLAPASFAQERLWFLDQLEPGNPSYNMPAAVRLCGQLDVAALQQSLNEIVRRHETLRTTFATTDGGPVQVIAPFVTSPLAVVDLRSCPEMRRETEAWRLIAAEARRPFDLARGPLFRATLLRLDEACPETLSSVRLSGLRVSLSRTPHAEGSAETQSRREQHVLLLNVSHIVSDGWSQGVLLRELAALYEAFSSGCPLPLPELSLQYADFARWQREWLQGEVLDAQLSYWKGQLGDAPAVLELPTDRPRPAAQTFHGARQTRMWSRSSSQALRALSQREGVTLFMTLLAAFQVLLYRYTGQTDLVVGSPVAGRNRAELEGLIGFFVNTLVLRTDLLGNPTFRELLRRVREMVTGAYAHQELPFEKLVDGLHLERDLSRNPLCQVMFALQNAPLPALEVPGLALTPLETDSGTARFDLTVSVWDDSQSLREVWEYNTDLFDARTIEQMQRHFQTLLERVVADPEQRISQLSLLSRAQRRQILVEWNATEADFSQDKCVHELFETQAAKTPDGVALVFQDQHLSYQRLNQHANQLAHYLQTLGIEPETRVGLCLERSLEVGVAILGVLKAGGAYVPLDPAYPEERLVFILQDTRAPLLLTQHALASHLLSPLLSTPCSLLLLDTDWPAIAGENEINPARGATVDNLAYVIYTSGSTGKPKGVLVKHQGLCNLAQAQIRSFHVHADSRVLQFASLSFDASVSELFVALLAGATLCLETRDTLLPGPSLIQLLRQQAITTVTLSPSLLAILPSGELPALRTIISAGEACFTDVMIRWAPGHQFLNAYGPTEGTVCATIAECPDNLHRPHIGRPIANVQIYVLDAHLQPVPVGVPGELYIGGAGLARGYLHRPAQTAERFVPNPFLLLPFEHSLQEWRYPQSRGGARLYRTGDLARFLPDGNIEFLGRLDHQLKIRGFRIELEEIEVLLAEHPAVHETIVLGREDVPGDSRLVAYVVPDDESLHQDAARALGFANELRSYVKKRLPAYMVPSAFVTLETWPLTPNGKVNRQALPPPDASRSEMEGAFVAPRTLVEEVLADIWAQLLGIERVGIYDDFFELGGHSLLAAQIISRVRDDFQVELALRELFVAPTVAALAGHIERVRHAERGLTAPPLLPVARDGSLPLSFAQQRLWFLDQLEPDSVAYNIPAAAHLTGQLDVPALARSMNEIVRRHETLRTTFATVDGHPVQVIAPGLTIALPVVDLREFPQVAQEALVRRLTVQEAWWRFDLARGPLLRATLLQLGKARPETWSSSAGTQGPEEVHVLLLNMHHIVSDGWSMGILIQELTAFYHAFSTGTPPVWPDLPIQYADYAAWQRQWLQGKTLEAQLSYWRRQLGDNPAALELPLDHPRPAGQNFQGARQTLSLPQALTQDLKALSRREGGTLFMTLLAAFKTLLYRYTGQPDISIGTPIAGRNRSELEGLIGLFINTLVLRTNMRGDPSFCELLGRVREVTLEAYAHQDIPFEKLVEELRPERDLSRNPLFDVLINFVNTPQTTIKVPGLTVTFREPAEPESKFSMTLYLRERESELDLQLVYRRARFSQQGMACLLNQFRYLLEQIVAAPEKPIQAYSLVTPESRALLSDPSVALPEPQHPLVTEAFQTWANVAPDRIAVCQGEHAWTYSKLAASARAVARELLARGLARGDVVAVSGPRCFELVASMLAALASGGVLLTLDQNLPAQRRRTMLEQASAKYLLRAGNGELKDEPGLIALRVDAGTGKEVLGDPGHPLPAPLYDDAAYIFFTSGTTGVPRGVLGCHKGLGHFLHWQRETFRVGARDRCAQLTALSFDVVLRDVFLPLTSGAALCLPEQGDEFGPDRVLLWLERERISVLHTVPALAQSWLSSVPTGVSLSALRWVFFAGEPLTEALVRRWRRAFSETNGIVNLYGPTETTLAKCFYRVPRDVLPGVQPVGRALPATQALVLSSNGRLCGVGEPGEIVLRTPFRSLGYINAPGENEKRFVVNPYRDDRQDLLYHTGDRGRYRPDGTLDILGRLDHQVKIRGVRVEPDEVTATLSRHPAVKSCIVVARKNERDENALVAYAVLAKQGRVVASELRGYLGQRLPAPMLPSAFVFLEQLPLTSNGKIDRRALPAPEWAKPESKRAFVAPRTPVEQTLASLWSQVLGVERVGVHDDFFELGGHSLLITQVFSQVRQAFRLALPLRDFFKAPTVAGLAQSIERARLAEQGLQAPPLKPVPRDGELPVSFNQERWLKLNRRSSSGRILRLSGSINVAALAQSLSEILRRHEALRTAFVRVQDRFAQVICPAQPLKMPLVDLQDLPESERELETRRLISADAVRPFDLSRGLLLRATLLRLDKEEHVLSLRVDHIVFDGWSGSVLLRELVALYEAFSAGKPSRQTGRRQSSLPELLVQYVDFAHWQREWLQGEALETLLSYWRRQLGNSPCGLALPTDRPRRKILAPSGAMQRLVMPPALCESLRSLSRRRGVTLFMTLLAAFKALMHFYTGQDDICVNVPFDNRTRAGTQSLIGYFVSTLPLRTNLSGDPSFRELLAQVREVVLGAYAHQIPNAILEQALGAMSQVSPSALCWVFFSFQDVSLELPQQAISYMQPDVETETYYDLSVWVVDSAQGLGATAMYNTDLFDAATIGRLLSHFQALLEGIVATEKSLEQRLSEIKTLIKSNAICTRVGESR